jgi:hypothetical protein
MNYAYVLPKQLARLEFTVRPGYTYPWGKVAVATKFCTLVPNFCGSSIWNLLHVTLLALKILRWLPDFRKCVHSRSKMMAVYNNYDTVRYRQLRNTRVACCLMVRDKVVPTGHVVSEELVSIFTRKREIPHKQLHLHTKLHGITFQTTAISTLSAMRSSNTQL